MTGAGLCNGCSMQERVSDVNAQAEKFVRENHFDVASIREKQERINQRYNL